MSIQMIVDRINAADSLDRAMTQLTLGELIDIVSAFDSAVGGTVPLGHPMSFRGYYTDLAFEPGETPLEEFIAIAKGAVGATFEGYKGGDYTMSRDSPLWVAEYSCTGPRLMGIKQCGSGVIITTAPDDTI